MRAVRERAAAGARYAEHCRRRNYRRAVQEQSRREREYLEKMFASQAEQGRPTNRKAN